MANQEDDDDYDPHLHRELSHPNTSPETLLHLLKAVLGTGILAMPEAFKYAGLLNGIISTMLIGMFVTYVIQILIRSQYIICKKMRKPFLTYPESMEIAIGMGPNCLRCFTNYAASITDVSLIFFQIGSCCVYILFVGENMRDIVNYYYETKIAVQWFALTCFIPFILIMCVKNLKIFASFSLVGNIISLITYGVIAFYVSHDLHKLSDLNMVGRYTQYPLYFGTAMFSLQSITVTVVAEANMARPMDFTRPVGVLNIAMVIATFLYIAVGTMGYWRYGEGIAASITLNFPIASPVGQAIRILYSLSVFVSYGLNLFAAVEVFWQDFMEKRYGDSSENTRWVLNYTIRFVGVIITFVLALSIPFLGIFISFVGSVLVTALMFIFPPMLELCVHWPDQLGATKWRLWKNIVIVIFAFFVLAAGIYSTVFEVIRRYQ